MFGALDHQTNGGTANLHQNFLGNLVMLEIPDHVWYSMSVLYGYVYAKKMYIYSYIICEKMYIYSYIIYVYIYIHTLKYVLLIETVYTHIISHLIWGQD